MDENNRLFPTPYDDVNLVLRTLLDNVQRVLGYYFIGMYLYGSLASGDFDPGRSDIDFLIVTSEGLPQNLILNLETMHKRTYESGMDWAKRMSGAYVPLDAVRKYSPAGPACPLINKNEFVVARPESDWVMIRHILYNRGIVIVGPPLQTIIDPVQPEQLREAVLVLLRNNWAAWIHHIDFFNGEGYQPYVVLTMCRALYTLKTGSVASKLQSAEWMLARSDKKWAKLIKQAIAWHYGDLPGDVGQTQEFMRYVFNEAGI